MDDIIASANFLEELFPEDIDNLEASMREFNVPTIFLHTFLPTIQHTSKSDHVHDVWTR